jgi:hypothetical protein
MERAMRSMVDQLNMMLKKTESSAESESGGFEEMLNSKLGTTEKNFANQVKEYWKTIYPVGAIYISASSTNPGTLFGGTWEQIKDRFLLAAGSSYSAGATGGAATHKLTVNEMPSHTHTIRRKTAESLSSGSGNAVEIAVNTHYTDDAIYGATATGGSAAHNNMPPYLAVYVWKRTK